ncbi:DUF600 domain-containing protein [Listeria aquatica]|uniref:DUF600 domain-containing protein n=1 Tax=Listeria aquatica TaxID=1494960 RepID=UPI0031F4B365
MAKMFEEYFTDLQADMVSICLEYSEKKVEKIYIYGSIENNTTAFNVFFESKGKLLHLNELNSVLEQNNKIDDHIDRQFGVLQIGVEDIEKIRHLCEEYKMDVPTEIKIQYDVLENNMNADYRYENVYSNTKDKTDNDIFNDWFEEIKITLS